MNQITINSNANCTVHYNVHQKIQNHHNIIAIKNNNCIVYFDCIYYYSSFSFQQKKKRTKGKIETNTHTHTKEQNKKRTIKQFKEEWKEK